jgi:hypothetical protein
MVPIIFNNSNSEIVMVWYGKYFFAGAILCSVDV